MHGREMPDPHGSQFDLEVKTAQFHSVFNRLQKGKNRVYKLCL